MLRQSPARYAPLRLSHQRLPVVPPRTSRSLARRPWQSRQLVGRGYVSDACLPASLSSIPNECAPMLSIIALASVMRIVRNGSGRRVGQRTPEASSADLWRVFLRRGVRYDSVDRDVEHGLLELFFHIDLAGRLQRQQVGAHPRDFRWCEPLLGDIHRLARQMRRSHVALAGPRSIDAQQMALHSMVRTAELTCSGLWNRS